MTGGHTAQSSNRDAMSALAAIIPPSQIAFGTDFPYRTGTDHVKGLREAGVLTEEQMAAIERTMRSSCYLGWQAGLGAGFLVTSRSHLQKEKARRIVRHA